MAKWFGIVGYSITEEASPGVWTETVTERSYYGDVLRNSRRYQSSENLNDNLNISNEISIVADPFAYQNFHNIRYVEFMGTNWKVSNIDVNYPRLTLSIGEVYNGEK